MKKTHKPLNFIVKGTVFPYDVMVSIGQTDEQLKTTLTEYECDYSEINFEMTGGGNCQMFNKRTLLRLAGIPHTPNEWGSLQHEIFHAIEFIMLRINMRLCLDNDEAYAYSIEYLTTEIYKRILPPITKKN